MATIVSILPNYTESFLIFVNGFRLCVVACEMGKLPATLLTRVQLNTIITMSNQTYGR